MDLLPALSPSSATATASFDRSGPNLTVYLTGELDAASAPSVTTAIFERILPGDERLWLDLSALTFCDSSGLVLLFKLHQLAEESGAHYALFEPTDPVRRIIALCDPSGVLRIRA